MDAHPYVYRELGYPVRRRPKGVSRGGNAATIDAGNTPSKLTPPTFIHLDNIIMDVYCCGEKRHMPDAGKPKFSLSTRTCASQPLSLVTAPNVPPSACSVGGGGAAQIGANSLPGRRLRTRRLLHPADREHVVVFAIIAGH